MACPVCNAHTRSYLQLCDPCIERKQLQRHSHLHQTKEQLRRASGADYVHSPMRTASIYILGTTVVLCLLTAFFLATGPVRSEGPAAAGAFALTAALTLIYFCTYGLFWTRLIVLEPLWAMGCFIMPCLVWKYVKLQWHESQVRILSIIHFGSMPLILLSFAVLAKATDLSYLETAALFSSYVHGEEINITEYKNHSGDYFVEGKEQYQYSELETSVDEELAY